jgi:hypothetical protein
LNAGLFVDGLLGGERRKTEWMRAERQCAQFAQHSDGLRRERNKVLALHLHPLSRTRHKG